MQVVLTGNGVIKTAGRGAWGPSLGWEVKEAAATCTGALGLWLQIQQLHMWQGGKI